MTQSGAKDAPRCAREVWLSGGPALARCEVHEPDPCPIPPGVVRRVNVPRSAITGRFIPPGSWEAP